MSNINRGLWIQCPDKFLLALKFHKLSVMEITWFIRQLGSKGWCESLRAFGDNVRCACVQCLLWIPPNWWRVPAGLLSPRSHTGSPRIGTTEGEGSQKCSALAPSAQSLLRPCYVKDNVGLEALSPNIQRRFYGLYFRVPPFCSAPLGWTQLQPTILDVSEIVKTSLVLDQIYAKLSLLETKQFKSAWAADPKVMVFSSRCRKYIFCLFRLWCFCFVLFFKFQAFLFSKQFIHRSQAAEKTFMSWQQGGMVSLPQSGVVM